MMKKVVLIGAPDVGKTTYINHLKGNIVDVSPKMGCQCYLFQDNLVWDCPGGDEWYTIRQFYFFIFL